MDAAEGWRVGLQLVREARIVGGRAAARRAWALAGLPDVFSEPVPALALSEARNSEAHRPVGEWLEERCELAPGVQVRTRDLYVDYEAWCSATGRAGMPIVAFGKLLSGFGIGWKVSNGSWRTGIRLRV
jgi:hypothetical protein